MQRYKLLIDDNVFCHVCLNPEPRGVIMPFALTFPKCRLYNLLYNFGH